MQNKVLGRGLSSLLKDETKPMDISGESSEIDIKMIEPNLEQPRKKFDEVKIRELSDSIVAHGLVQPIVVNKKVSGKYKIIAGERRFRACQLAGLKSIPVIMKNLSSKEILEIALIENIQRQDLTVMEEAEGFQKLIQEYGYSHSELSMILGKSRSHITNLLRLNSLNDAIKDLVNNGDLSMGHARCLVGLDNATTIANKIIEKDLNVRQTEDLINSIKHNEKNYNRPENKGHIAKSEIDEDLLILAQSLSEKFGAKVVIENFGNKGKIAFHYTSLEELDSILSQINKE